MRKLWVLEIAGSNPASPTSFYESAKPGGPKGGPVEDLTRAIADASSAAQWDVVGMLARQLEALTHAPSRVVDLEAEARKRGRR